MVVVMRRRCLSHEQRSTLGARFGYRLLYVLLAACTEDSAGAPLKHPSVEGHIPFSLS